MANVKRRLTRFLLVGLMSATVASCGALQEKDFFEPDFWRLSEGAQNDYAELGMAEMAKGNHITAEADFRKALKENPNDVHALLGLGMLYQNTGQKTKAREMYEAVLALRPDQKDQFVVWKSLSTRPVSEIASVNLALLESGGVVSGLGRGAAGEKAENYKPGDVMTAPPVSGASAPNAMVGSDAAGPATAVSGIADADENILSRFGTLRSLRDQGLVTQEEYATRRQANVGALLPLTTPPPAAGLDRPVPTTEQISGRLRVIGRALEMRAMSVAQHASERKMILDALMPSSPVVVANPAVPPKGLLEAADSVRRLESLRDQGFITPDEYARERAAIEKAMQPSPPPMPKAQVSSAMPQPLGGKGETMAKSGPQPAVHLASYRTQKAAERGWAQLQKTHGTTLRGLDHEISKVAVRGKGTYWRLKAGPLDSEAAAKSLCQKLKRRRQYCEPSMMSGN
jgi:tetratricopeptide (TPR) repeat protein